MVYQAPFPSFSPCLIRASKQKRKTARMPVIVPIGLVVAMAVTTTTTMTMMIMTTEVAAGIDLRGSITGGTDDQNKPPCIDYDSQNRYFELTCDIGWKDSNYGNDNFITLYENEVFDGNHYTINLTGFNEFQGLFEFQNEPKDGRSGDIPSFMLAPVIRNLHVRNGATSTSGGFIVRTQQKFFIVESCSSSGIIKGGGICGDYSGLNGGQIKITNSSSTGEVSGEGAGGIAGKHVGHNGGTVNITDCYSTGNMEIDAGGICGKFAGDVKGQIFITNCHSEGHMQGDGSGGIGGAKAAFNESRLVVGECSSTGEIVGRGSGGIIGIDAAQVGGILRITMSHSMGKVYGQNAGGLCGSFPYEGTVEGGTLHIFQSYSSGEIHGSLSGGILGEKGGARGIATIIECYSTGNITGYKSGGIVGGNAGDPLGQVCIRNCYTRGNIEGEKSGGICGALLGGTVSISHSYASGIVSGSNAGGLVGYMRPSDADYKGGGFVGYSVYNSESHPVIAHKHGSVSDVFNSGEIDDITGKLYKVNDEQWCDSIWAVEADGLPVLRFQLPAPTPRASFTPSATMSRTSTRTATKTRTFTLSKSPATTPTRSTTARLTGTPTCTMSESTTSTASIIPDVSTSGSATSSPSNTRRVIPTVTSSPSGTVTAVRAPKETSTATSTGIIPHSNTRSVISTATSPPSSIPDETPNNRATVTSALPNTRTAISTATSSPSGIYRINLTPTLTTSATKTPILTTTSSVIGTIPTGSPAATKCLDRSSESPGASRWPSLGPGVTHSCVYTKASDATAPSSSLAELTGTHVTGTMTFSVRSTSFMSSDSPMPTSSGAVLEQDNKSSKPTKKRDSFSSSAQVYVPSALAGSILLLLIYLGYQRRKNENAAKACNDPKSRYASKLGIDPRCLKVMSSMNGNPVLPEQKPIEQKKGTWLHTQTWDQDEVAESPILSANVLHETHSSSLRSTGDRKQAEQREISNKTEAISDKFSLTVGKAERRSIKSLSISDMHPTLGSIEESVGIGNENVHGNASRNGSEMPAVLWHFSARSMRSLEAVRIVSAHSPKITRGEKNSAIRKSDTMHVAVAANVDTGQLRLLDRAFLKLRQWKARLLAEPPPLVQIGMPSDSKKPLSTNPLLVSSGCAPVNSFSGHASPLEFAISKPVGLSRETREHHRIQLRLEADPPRTHFAPKAPRSKPGIRRR
eukprot:gb/GECG01014641.1/.p1 GENE.gb/GECG01014641.1/~~gb/GECG01014641.1/.p1  ORF type:complete len:1200 (+),score=146.13 gb/GECG01014641.1/:1-3600(+)